MCVPCFRSVMKEYLARQEEKALGQDVGSVRPSNPFTKTLPSGLSDEGTTGIGGLSQVAANKRATGQTILVMLLRLRQCCSHLSLMKDVSLH